MKHSIKNRLLWTLTSTLSLVLLLNGILSHIIVRHEVDEAFNAELVITAEIIKGLINNKNLTNNISKVSAALNETLDGLETISPEIKIYKDKLLLQVWQETDKHMLFQSANSPPYALAPLKKGFYQRNNHDIKMDVYVTDIPAIHGWLQIGEIPHARNEIDTDIASIFLVSSLSLVGISCLLIILSIKFGLLPLKRLSKLLQLRTFDNLQTIHIHNTPKELVPVISGLNRLFSRLSLGIERERRFVADAAHELRTPLAVLKLHSQHLQKVVPEALHDDVNQLLIGVERGNRVVEQMLLLARIEKKNNFATPHCIDAVEFSRQRLAELYWQAEKRQCSLELSTTLKTLWLNIDPSLLEIVLRNLLENALRYGGDDNQLCLGIEHQDTHIMFTVRDTGPGVASEELPRICERFYRGSSSLDTGAGLGLSITQRIVDGLGGSIRFSNLPIKGFEARIIFDVNTLCTKESPHHSPRHVRRP